MLSSVIEPPYDYTFCKPKFDFCYIGIPRCGSNMMKTLLKLHTQDLIPIEKSLQFATRLTIIRHPVFRLISAWKHGWIDYPFQKWLEQVLDNPDFDIHTMLYTTYLQDYTTDIVPLEQIQLWWKTYHYKLPYLFPFHSKIVNISPSIPLSLTPAQKHHIEKVYHDDVLLWKNSLIQPLDIQFPIHN